MPVTGASEGRAQSLTAARRKVLLVAALSLVVGACPGPVRLTPDDVANARIVTRWLTCEECTAGELDSIRVRGSLLAPQLRAALEGPPDTVRTHFTQSAGRSFAIARRQFARRSQIDQQLSPLGDSATFVNDITRNFQLLYRTRAARALVAITPGSARGFFRRQLVLDSIGTNNSFGPALRHYLDSLVNSPP